MPLVNEIKRLGDVRRGIYLLSSKSSLGTQPPK